MRDGAPGLGGLQQSSWDPQGPGLRLGTTSGRFPDRGGDGVLDTALFVVHIFLAAVASLTSVPHPLNGSSIPLSYDNQKVSHTLHGIKGTVPPC